MLKGPAKTEHTGAKDTRQHQPLNLRAGYHTSEFFCSPRMGVGY